MGPVGPHHLDVLDPDRRAQPAVVTVEIDSAFRILTGSSGVPGVVSARRCDGAAGDKQQRTAQKPNETADFL